MSNEVQKSETKSPAELIASAVTANTDLDKLAKLLELQERWDATQAKKAYHQAMADFKANPPKIEKDRTVAFGNTKYTHASLANVTDTITKELSKYGLSASWRTKQNGSIEVSCRITHVMGHSEETSICAPADTSGSKNAIQAIGSAITYLQRYTLLAITGLAAHDMDDDGQAAEPRITKEQIDELYDWMTKVKVSEAAILKTVQLDSIDKMTQRDYKIVLTSLKAKVKNANS